MRRAPPHHHHHHHCTVPAAFCTRAPPLNLPVCLRRSFSLCASEISIKPIARIICHLPFSGSAL